MNTEIICIIDKSGSMGARAQDAIGGFNAFVEEQRKLGDATLSLVLFDTTRTEVFTGMDLKDVPPLGQDTYQPSGMTALLDAVGITIDRAGAAFARRSTPPQRVIVAIITDGEENSSKEYTAQMVRERVEHQQNKYGWQFIYLGANQDAWAMGSTMGIRAGDTYAWDSHTARGVSHGYQTMSMAVGDYRTDDDD